MTARRLALTGLTLATALLAVTMGRAAGPPPVPAWVVGGQILAVPLLLVALMLLGLARPGRRIGLGWGTTLLLTWLAVAGAWGIAWLAPPDVPGDPLLLGWPRRTAAVLLGAGLLPFCWLPVAYALWPGDDADAPDNVGVPVASAGS